MSTPDPRLSRRDAERLLDAPAEHDDVLGWALTAASAPAHPSELRREDETAAAFQAARLAPPPSSRSGYVSPSRLGSRAAVRAVVATGAVVALTSGGFALASSADLPGIPDLPGLPGLPALPGQAPDDASESVSGSTSADDGGSSAVDGTDSPGASGSAGSSTSPGSPSATTSQAPSESPSESPSQTSDGPASPTPDFEGLCRAFQAADRSEAGSSLGSAAFLALAAQAGGADRIATYCVDLIGPPKQTGQPTSTTQPSPTKPTPTHPTPTHPTPTKPTPTHPTPTKPTPTKPSPTKPTPTHPTPTKPTPTKPTQAPSPATPSDTPTPSPGKPTTTPTPTPGKPSDLPTRVGPGSSGNPDEGGGTHTSG